jgi:hypothetical protein
MGLKNETRDGRRDELTMHPFHVHGLRERGFFFFDRIAVKFCVIKIGFKT